MSLRVTVALSSPVGAEYPLRYGILQTATLVIPEFGWARWSAGAVGFCPDPVPIDPRRTACRSESEAHLFGFVVVGEAGPLLVSSQRVGRDACSGAWRYQCA